MLPVFRESSKNAGHSSRPVDGIEDIVNRTVIKNVRIIPTTPLLITRNFILLMFEYGVYII